MSNFHFVNPAFYISLFGFECAILNLPSTEVPLHLSAGFHQFDEYHNFLKPSLCLFNICLAKRPFIFPFIKIDLMTVSTSCSF